ncbi:Sodium-coupled monocarboxylate transporter 1 [Nymphon striatum]|nr:Sodium-coupled monocarboxylate transporter 1 [Nymphon striatum]
MASSGNNVIEFNGMENYEKKEVILPSDEAGLKLIPDLPSNVIHVRVKGGSKLRNLIGFALSSFKDESKRHIVFTGHSDAISKAISCAEIVKTKLKNLHQVTKIDYAEQEEIWKPKIENIDTLKAARQIPLICILLCKDSLDEKEDGYQPPGNFVKYWNEKMKLTPQNETSETRKKPFKNIDSKAKSNNKSSQQSNNFRKKRKRNTDSTKKMDRVAVALVDVDCFSVLVDEKFNPSKQDLSIKMNKFSVADYVAFILMLIVSALIGVYYACTGGKQKTTSEFLVGNRSMKIVPVAMSLFASILSAIALIGIPNDVYMYGSELWLMLIPLLISITISAFLFLPVFFDLKLISLNEINQRHIIPEIGNFMKSHIITRPRDFVYLEMRFNKTTRSIGCCLFLISTLLYMAIALYAPSLALNQGKTFVLHIFTELPLWGSVLSMAVVCIFYTSIGGMKAVVWTDTFQTLVILGSILFIVIKSTIDMGGIGAVWNKNIIGGRLNTFNFDLDPTVRHSFWPIVIGGSFLWTAVYGINQTMTQRYASLPTLRAAQIALYVNFIPMAITISLCAIGGLLLYTKYHDCDPISTKRISAPDQIYPLFVVETLGNFPGVSGLFVSGVLSGALSTVSSGVNSLAAVTVADSPTVFYGVVALCLVALVSQFGQVSQVALTTAGILGGPNLGLFTLGIFFPWCNEKGAIAGTLGGLVISSWIGFGALQTKPVHPRPPISVAGCPELYMNVTNNVNWENITQYNFSIDSFLPAVDLSKNDDILFVYRLSYFWTTLIALVSVIIIGMITSAITGFNKLEDIDPKLITPFLRKKKLTKVEDDEDEDEDEDMHLKMTRIPCLSRGTCEQPEIIKMHAS